MAIQISGCPVIDDSRNLTNIANATTAATANTYVLRDANGVFLNETVLIKSFGSGSALAGGNIICKVLSVAWIVAPNTSEVARTWYLRNDANTRAQQVSGCTGWFVPTVSQLQNPGYTCRIFWDSYSTDYWSSTEINATTACSINLASISTSGFNKNTATCVRAFRCVTY
jgi:hypothetical protein